jgi:hypothetical protein
MTKPGWEMKVNLFVSDNREAKTARQRRLVSALRDNLGKRKLQARIRQSHDQQGKDGSAAPAEQIDAANTET